LILLVCKGEAAIASDCICGCQSLFTLLCLTALTGFRPTRFSGIGGGTLVDNPMSVRDAVDNDVDDGRLIK
jgi:hypothetical protein